MEPIQSPSSPLPSYWASSNSQYSPSSRFFSGHRMRYVSFVVVPASGKVKGTFSSHLFPALGRKLLSRLVLLTVTQMGDWATMVGLTQ